MSEYITFQIEGTDDPDCTKLVTNITLTVDETETYHSRAEGDEGSPLAQTLFAIEGIAGLEMAGGLMTIWRDPDADIEWPALIDEIVHALRDFFL